MPGMWIVLVACSALDHNCNQLAVEYHAVVALTSASHPRLAYIDWMRGLACVLMFQDPLLRLWLSPSLRQSKSSFTRNSEERFLLPYFYF